MNNSPLDSVKLKSRGDKRKLRVKSEVIPDVKIRKNNVFFLNYSFSHYFHSSYSLLSVKKL